MSTTLEPVWKQILLPGTELTRRGLVSFGLRDLQHYRTSGNRMLDAGVRIPIPLEHQPSALPLSWEDSLAKGVLNNTGWVQRFAEANDGTLWALLGVEDPDAYRKLKTTIKYVSPSLAPKVWVAGREWENVIAHVALTPQPVQFNQLPFGAEPGQFRGDGASLAARSTPPMVRAATNLSHWLEPGELLSLSAANQVQFERGQWLRLSHGDDAMKDDADMDMDMGDGADADFDAIPPDMPEDTGLGAGEDKTQLLVEAKAILAKLGVPLPDGTNESNLLEHICVAGHALLNSDNGNGGMGTSEDPANQQPPGGQQPMAQEEPRVVSMSTKTLNETRDVLTKLTGALQQTKIELSTAQQRAERAETKLAKRDQQMFGAVIESLARDGKCRPADAEAWKNVLATKQLSLATGEDAEVNAILAKIEFAKGLPKGTFWTSEQKSLNLSAARAEPRHELAQFSTSVGNMTTDKIDAILEEAYGAA